jgi:coenzyme F420-dependent glucose-6-phosphate dehydrogenase
MALPVKIGFHASHEQFSPRDLLQLVQQAEQAGFAAAMSSDHFHPWSEVQGQSGFSWSWLGAAMQATALDFGCLAIPMGWRYHPAIVAQAGATLAEMFPGRFRWMALGTGQALNEHITGGRWPAKPERQARLRQAVEIMRALWRGETVTTTAEPMTDEARLYVRAEPPPLLYAAALTPQTAGWAGAWADGMITVNQPPDKLRQIIDAFRGGGGEGKPVCLQVHLGWGRSDDEARHLAYTQWRGNIVGASVAETLRMPADFQSATQFVRPDDLEGYVLVSADMARHRAWIEEFAALGCAEIYLHNTGANQRAFIDACGEELLPAFAAAGA